MKITILTEPEIRECVALDAETVAAIADSFTALADGRAVTPIMSIPVDEHNGEMHVKSAVIEGYDSFAVKIASGFYDNPKIGLPSGSGIMQLFSARTGFPEAILLDNGYLTDVRTAAAGTIAADHFARKDLETVGVIGAGAQGRYQIQALKLVRDFKRVLVYSRGKEWRDRYAKEMSAELGIECVAVDSAEPVVRESNFVVTATPSTEPIIRAEWVHPGLHITAMGADNGHKQELYADVLGRADRLICDLREQVLRLGEHKFALEAGVISKDTPIDELGEITAGRKPGRASDEEITVCDLTGVGTQDTAIAVLAYQKAQAKGLGFQAEF